MLVPPKALIPQIVGNFVFLGWRESLHSLHAFCHLQRPHGFVQNSKLLNKRGLKIRMGETYTLHPFGSFIAHRIFILVYCHQTQERKTTTKTGTFLPSAPKLRISVHSISYVQISTPNMSFFLVFYLPIHGIYLTHNIASKDWLAISLCHFWLDMNRL